MFNLYLELDIYAMDVVWSWHLFFLISFCVCQQAVKNKELKTVDLCVNLPVETFTQSSVIDLRMGTQDFLESCMNLSQDTFVKGFDPFQAKVEDSLDWLELPKSLKMPTRRLDDLDMELYGEDDLIAAWCLCLLQILRGCMTSKIHELMLFLCIYHSDDVLSNFTTIPNAIGYKF